jgi:hypothetical protein
VTDLLVAATWNGVIWRSARIVPAPIVGHSPHVSISCPSLGHCFALASASKSRANQSVLEVLSGTTWRGSTIPQVGESALSLTSISCPDATHCVAVGRSSRGPVVDMLNGATWTQRQLTTPGPTSAAITGVSCRDLTHCAAVGTYRISASRTGSFSARLVGSQWSVHPTAAPPGASSVTFVAVSCATTTSCTAVGFDRVGAAQLPIALAV